MNGTLSASSDTLTMVAREPVRVSPWLALVAMCCVLAPAQAAAGPGQGEQQVYLNAGLEVGLATSLFEDGVGGSLGGRASLNDVVTVFLPLSWEGTYLHVNHDFGTGAWRGGLGAGLGVFFFGGELGAVTVFDDRGATMGVEAAVLATMGLVGIHLRHTLLIERSSVTELGLRLTMPFKVD